MPLQPIPLVAAVPVRMPSMNQIDLFENYLFVKIDWLSFMTYQTLFVI